MTKLKDPKEGDRVSCISYSDKIKNGTIESVLSTQIFIEFDDGTHAFVTRNEPTLMRLS